MGKASDHLLLFAGYDANQERVDANCTIDFTCCDIDPAVLGA